MYNQINLDVNEAKLKKAVARAKERGLRIPTLRQMKDPDKETPMDVKEGLTDFFVWLVTHSPQIAIFLVVVFLLSLLGKVLGKRRAAKRAEKAARLAAASHTP